MRRRLFLALVLALAGFAPPATAQEAPDPAARLAAMLDDFHGRYGFPGATAAIVLPDGTVVTAATGLADIEAGRAMTPDTPMPAAGIGESFVAATVLALESEGRLSRADPLSAHLGDRPWFDALPNAHTITIDHLLRHSAGLPDHVYLPEFQRARAGLADGDGFDPETLVGFVTGHAPLSEAGAEWAYSDTGYVLLGLVIEAVTGQDWQVAVRSRLLDPLGLHATIPLKRQDLPDLAVGYVDPDNPYSLPVRTADAQGRLLWNPAVDPAGGGFASTSADLARWGHLLFGGKAMRQPYLDRLLYAVPAAINAPGISYGAGVGIRTAMPGGPVYGHGGRVPAYVSSLLHHADPGVTVAFQINTDSRVEGDMHDLVPTLEAALAELAIAMIR